LQALQRKRHVAFLKRLGVWTALVLRVAPIFGDIGQLVKVAKCTNHVLGLGLIERGDGSFQAAETSSVMLPSILNGGAADPFYQGERACAGVFADGVAQDASKQANVLAQGLIGVVFVLGGGALAHGENLAWMAARPPWAAKRIEAKTTEVGMRRKSDAIVQQKDAAVGRQIWGRHQVDKSGSA
jgi:hypothetical protein